MTDTEKMFARAYTIKPLNWVKTKHGYYTANSRGAYGVERRDSVFYWSYCWIDDEDYDEDQFECKSYEDGKQKAEEHYIGRNNRC